MQNIRWGLIGCGDIARKRVAPALRDAALCDFVSVSRRQSGLAESFAREFGARKSFADWREQIADPDIDAVYIATPVSLHAEQTIAAASAGKHVLCEKPTALTPAECEQMIAACAAANVKLGVAYYRRFYPVIARIREIIASGEIGDVMLAQCNAFEYFNPGPEHPRAWFVNKAMAGGGPMMDFGCHRIEVLLNLLGPITETHGFTDNLRFTREVEDTSAAFFRFASGARATLTVTHTAATSQDTLDIFGTTGSLHIPVLNLGLLRIRTAAGERAETHTPHANLQQPRSRISRGRFSMTARPA
ncbi:MAG: Gfo/Idh/MocA family protein [Blastocatellia bacterium]